jgi:tetratricopeptide (TPR) repeat protein
MAPVVAKEKSKVVKHMDRCSQLDCDPREQHLGFQRVESLPRGLLMGSFRRKPRYFCTLAVSAAFVTLASFLAQGQSSAASEPAVIYGVVRDARGQPVPAASVHMQLEGTKQVVTVETDSKGAYRCGSLREGVYNLHAEKAGSGDGSAGSVVLKANQASKVDFTLAVTAPNAGQSSAAKAPEFFDEPQFTVAGVIDATNHGGHGSDAIFRTSRSLARDVASINPQPVTSPTRSVEEEASLREAVKRAPESFEANQQLGIFLARSGHPKEAVPYLERSNQSRPEDYESAYTLAQAYLDAADYEHAAAIGRGLLAKHDTAAVHHLLGDVEEKRKRPVEAVGEYQRAAELDPSEPNFFDWGAELLTHRALQPAIEVFSKGNHLFPQSARMLVGLGVAWYATGSSDLAAKYVCDASDLNPGDGNPYLVLGKMQMAHPSPSSAVLARMERFVRLQPNNALANYYYAVALWKTEKTSGVSSNPANAAQIESLLENAVRLDPKLARGFLQLGILSEERSDLPKAIAAYQTAIATDSQLEEAHYRLAQIYRRMGEKLKAQEEIKLYEQISQKTARQAEEEGREIPQFVYTLRDPKSPAQSQ